MARYADKQSRLCKWEHFSHEADLGIRGYGDSIATAFSQAATAMTAAICDVGSIRPIKQRQIKCEAPDYELLFVDWLNALIYEMATARMLFNRFDIQIHGLTLQATAWGELVDRSRHQPVVEVKGATYTELKVTQQKDGQWIVQCVIDV